MKTMQVYFIYVYDSVRGWVKCNHHINPISGFEFEEDVIKAIVLHSTSTPEKEFTFMPIYKTI